MFNPPSLIGVDIGQFSSKIVVLTQIKRRLALVACNEHVNDKNNNTMQPVSVLSGLRKIVTGLPRSRYRLMVALPDSSTMTQSLGVACGADARECEAVLWQGMGEHLGLPPTELQLDYVQQPAAQRKRTGLPEDMFLVVAAKKDLVEQRMQQCQHLGLRAHRLEPESYGLLRWARFVGSARSGCGVIDIGATQVRLLVERGPDLFHTEASLGEESDMDGGLSWPQRVAAIITLLLQRFNAVSSGHDLQGLYLVGGRSGEATCRDIQPGVAIPLYFISPFYRLPLGPKGMVGGGQYALALGLALGGEG